MDVVKKVVTVSGFVSKIIAMGLLEGPFKLVGQSAIQAMFVGRGAVLLLALYFAERWPWAGGS